MKYNLLVIFFVTSYFATAQNIIVYDSVNNISLPYVAIQFGDKGIYTDDKGSFDIKDITSDSLQINIYGYNKVSLVKIKLKDTVFLQPKAQVLDEVVITNKQTIINIKPSQRIKMNGSWPLIAETEIITFIKPNKNVENTLIKELSFGFEKLKKRDFSNGKTTQPKAVVRVNIYTVDDGIIEDKIYSELKIIDVLKKDMVVLDLEKEVIHFPKEGLGFGIEFIKYVNNDPKNTKHIRPALINEVYKDFEANTIYSFPLNKNKPIYQINKLLNDSYFNATKKHKNFNRNLMIGFILIK